MIKLYFQFIKTYIKKITEYRFSFFTSIFLQVFSYSNTFLIMWILLQKFTSIHGWSYYELMFLYTLNLLSYALSGMFVKHPMLDFEQMIQKGEFDIALTKPMPTLFYVISRQYEYTFLGHVFLSIVTLGISSAKLNYHWNSVNIVWLLIFLFSGSMIQSAFMILAGSMSFFFVKSRTIVETAIFGLRSFLDYPLSIFPGFIQVLLTFIFPYALVNFYPAEILLQKKDGIVHVQCWMIPLVGILLLIFSVLVWNIGVKKYESVGN